MRLDLGFRTNFSSKARPSSVLVRLNGARLIRWWSSRHSACKRDVRYWHKADIPELSINVRYWG